MQNRPSTERVVPLFVKEKDVPAVSMNHGGGAGYLQVHPLRFIIPCLFACMAMFTLFWLLYALIAGTSGGAQNSEILPTVDFVRLAKNFEIESRQRKPPEMPDRPEAPPEVPVQSVQVQGPTQTQVSINMSLENTTQVKANFGLSSTDGEYLPIVKVAPMYPARAQSQGIEGWVLVKFTVNEAGAVVDPVVLEAQPPGVFDEAARKAVLKFKYKPRVESGRPIAVPNVQHLIRFELDK
ncbi:MAG TPA: energy transducer TonB [Solimonas sp.]|nr:energy transducer TonB [Solimonas sp.]